MRLVARSSLLPHEARCIHGAIYLSKGRPRCVSRPSPCSAMFISDWDYLSLTRVAFTRPHYVTLGNFTQKYKRKIVNKIHERRNPWRRLHHYNLKKTSDINIRSAAIKFRISRDLYWRFQTTRERINIRVANIVRLVGTLVLIKKYKSHLAGARRGSTWGNPSQTTPDGLRVILYSLRCKSRQRRRWRPLYYDSDLRGGDKRDVSN